jgi:hypothetical protein
MLRLRAVLGQPIQHGTRRLLLFALLDFNQFRPRLARTMAIFQLSRQMFKRAHESADPR